MTHPQTEPACRPLQAAPTGDATNGLPVEVDVVDLEEFDAARPEPMTRAPRFGSGRQLGAVIVVFGLLAGVVSGGVGLLRVGSWSAAWQQAIATLMLVVLCAVLTVLGAVAWGHLADVARLRPLLAAVVAPSVLEQYGWRDSARIVLRTALLVVAGISFAFQVPASDGTAVGIVWTTVRMTLALMPLAIAGGWVLLDATPTVRPDGWPVIEWVRPRYVIVVPVLVVSTTLITAMAAVAWPEQGWMTLAVGALLVGGLAAVPYLLLVGVVASMGARLAWRHLGNAVRGFNTAWGASRDDATEQHHDPDPER